MKAPYPILHVAVNMNRGGAETLIMNLFRHIDRSQIQFDFLTFREGSFDEEIRRLGGHIHRLPYINESGAIQFWKSLIHFFRTHPEYHIVHSHLDKMSGFILSAAKKAGIPFRIAHSHNTQSEGSWLIKGVKWYAGHQLTRSATHHLACSTLAAQWLYGNTTSADILKNGIDTRHFHFSQAERHQIRGTLHLHEDAFVVGHVGRMNEQKNHMYLLAVFSEIIEKNKCAHLLLIGEGPLKAELKHKVMRLQLQEHVHFLGVREDVHQLLQAMDLMLFPSRHEGLPVSLIEAQGAGLPCLISDSISREVDVGANLVAFESLHHSPSIWADRALKLKRSKGNMKNWIKKAGYDIRDSASWLENYYLELYIKQEALILNERR
ncbi:putative glycosyltransferase EpsF [Pullulanibacillus camelliae]|uniref:Putative glycosyltransferase EpsF n=1 Tax=Pullulanibacillus camelliae TaxID=1707096 RepID=A0A8J2VI93_9BACL|nr:glycosyltransferase family 1 protein [Pullulanibacillus camelliae]GGE30457.1 putative glycosyltransferase EpsF [Pullulanibacillus camelliae]